MKPNLFCLYYFSYVIFFIFQILIWYSLFLEIISISSNFSSVSQRRRSGSYLFIHYLLDFVLLEKHVRPNNHTKPQGSGWSFKSNIPSLTYQIALCLTQWLWTFGDIWNVNWDMSRLFFFLSYIPFYNFEVQQKYVIYMFWKPIFPLFSKLHPVLLLIVRYAL